MCRWRLSDQARKVHKVFQARLILSSMRRLLQRPEFADLSARLLHPRTIDRRSGRFAIALQRLSGPRCPKERRRNGSRSGS